MADEKTALTTQPEDSFKEMSESLADGHLTPEDLQAVHDPKTWDEIYNPDLTPFAETALDIDENAAMSQNQPSIPVDWKNPGVTEAVMWRQCEDKFLSQAKAFGKTPDEFLEALISQNPTLDAQKIRTRIGISSETQVQPAPAKTVPTQQI